MGVLEELDAGKKGLSESARNVRQVSRFLDELMANATKEQIDRGLELPAGRSGNHDKKPPQGRLFFQTRRLAAGLPDTLPGHGIDNALLGYTLALQLELPGTRVTRSRRTSTCASRRRSSVPRRDYFNDRTIEDATCRSPA
jgi:PhoH-like ATPase